MSEIPYVASSDALDGANRQAGSRPRLRRLGRRRHLAVALAALAVAGGGAAIAGTCVTVRLTWQQRAWRASNSNSGG